MPRSVKKGPYVPHYLAKKLRKLNAENKKETIKTRDRDATITLDFIGHTFLIHRGNKFVPLYVDEAMLEHKLGEFADTRVFRAHSSKKKK